MNSTVADLYLLWPEVSTLLYLLYLCVSCGKAIPMVKDVGMVYNGINIESGCIMCIIILWSPLFCHFLAINTLLIYIQHDWLTVLRDIFAPSGVRISPLSIVTVVTPDYFRNLNSVIRNTSIKYIHTLSVKHFLQKIFLYICSVLENYAKWQTTLKIEMALSVVNTIRETMNQFKETFLAKPSMEQRQECVSYVESAMRFLLGRIYAEHILPSGSKVSG